MNETQVRDKSNRTSLVLIFAIPVVVLLASTALYFLADARMINLGEANRGTLITPPVQISELQLRDAQGVALDYSLPEPRWSYLVIGGRQCEGLCERALYVTGQTHKLLGKKINQVQRFYISTEGAPDTALQQLLDSEHRGLRTAYAEAGDIKALLAGLDADPMAEDIFFLVDPRGWVMMYYTVANDSQQTLSSLSKDMIKDIKRLIP